MKDVRVGGIILAGGQSRRMGGGDKCLKLLRGRTLLSRVIDRVTPQTCELILNANGDLERFENFKLHTVADVVGGSFGPLAGILTGMEWMRAHFEDIGWIASFPSDAPFIPTDFVDQCLNSDIPSGTKIICAKSGGRTHPVCALWRVELSDNLRFCLEKQNLRKIDVWTSNFLVHYKDFETYPIDPFFNINSEIDLREAGKLEDKQSIDG